MALSILCCIHTLILVGPHSCGQSFVSHSPSVQDMFMHSVTVTACFTAVTFSLETRSQNTTTYNNKKPAASLADDIADTTRPLLPKLLADFNTHTVGPLPCGLAISLCQQSTTNLTRKGKDQIRNQLLLLFFRGVAEGFRGE